MPKDLETVKMGSDGIIFEGRIMDQLRFHPYSSDTGLKLQVVAYSNELMDDRKIDKITEPPTFYSCASYFLNQEQMKALLDVLCEVLGETLERA